MNEAMRSTKELGPQKGKQPWANEAAAKSTILLVVPLDGIHSLTFPPPFFFCQLLCQTALGQKCL